MELLQQKKLPFGVSCCYTAKNASTIGSEEYIDWIIATGAKFCWIFTYMPVGNGAPTDLMATTEQQEFMYHQVRQFRQTKPLFTMDFWNDAKYVGGCIAGGRNYLHINANGDIEPCAFIHYSDSNIKEKTLIEAFQSPLFMAYRKGQPFNENMLRPCPLLDNPGRLTNMVEKSGVHSTDMQMPEDVRQLSDKCRKKCLWKRSLSKRLLNAATSVATRFTTILAIFMPSGRRPAPGFDPAFREQCQLPGRLGRKAAAAF